MRDGTCPHGKDCRFRHLGAMYAAAVAEPKAKAKTKTKAKPKAKSEGVAQARPMFNPELLQIPGFNRPSRGGNNPASISSDHTPFVQQSRVQPSSAIPGATHEIKTGLFQTVYWLGGCLHNAPSRRPAGLKVKFSDTDKKRVHKHAERRTLEPRISDTLPEASDISSPLR